MDGYEADREHENFIVPPERESGIVACTHGIACLLHHEGEDKEYEASKSHLEFD